MLHLARMSVGASLPSLPLAYFNVSNLSRAFVTLNTSFSTLQVANPPGNSEMSELAPSSPSLSVDENEQLHKLWDSYHEASDEVRIAYLCIMDRRNELTIC